jgi:hypothetical protein
MNMPTNGVIFILSVLGPTTRLLIHRLGQWRIDVYWHTIPIMIVIEGTWDMPSAGASANGLSEREKIESIKK